MLHHESGERHECRIPLAVRSSVDPDPWPIDAADELRHTSTDWNDDHGPFVEHLARRGLALLHGCGVESGTVLTVGNHIGFVRNTNYGELFDVVAEPDPINLAYTPLGLRPTPTIPTGVRAPPCSFCTVWSPPTRVVRAGSSMGSP